MGKISQMKYAAFTLALIATAALAQEPVFTVGWDAVNDSRVGKYVVGYGPASGQYDHEVVVEKTQLQADILDVGYTTYYVVVKACTDNRSLCSEWSNEVSAVHDIDAPINLRFAVQQFQSTLDAT